ncbi:hypothetical protein NOF04DRAFT_1155171, partial [Fusarium oxysporum II5]
MATYPQDANSGILDQALIDVQVPHDTADGVGFQAKPRIRTGFHFLDSVTAEQDDLELGGFVKYGCGKEEIDCVTDGVHKVKMTKIHDRIQGGDSIANPIQPCGVEGISRISKRSDEVQNAKVRPKMGRANRGIKDRL